MYIGKMSCITVGQRISLIESIFGKGTTDRNKTNIAVRCPICERDGRDVKTKKKLIIRIDNDMSHCWVCGWKSRTVLPLVKMISSHSVYEEYRSSIKECVNINDFSQSVDKSERILRLPLDFKRIVDLKKDDDRRRTSLKYLKSRGLNLFDIEFWNLGVSSNDEYRNKIIIPSFDKTGKLNYITSRVYINAKKGRSYSNCDVDKTTIVFNEFNINWSEDVVICEGPFDMFKCGKNSIPLLGSEISSNSAVFFEILINNPVIVIALDSDMKVKVARIAKTLMSYEIKVKVVDVESDPGEMSKDDFSLLLNTAKSWSWNKMFERKLDQMFL